MSSSLYISGILLCLHGPEHWYKKYPACGGDFQSPVDIDTNSVWYDSGLTALDWVHYGAIPRNAHWEITNTGDSVHIVLDGDYHLWDGGLPGTFKAVYASLHWGAEDHWGSEHAMNGQTFPMELQIVHYDTSLGSYDEALHKEDGIAVLAFFYRVGQKENRVYDQILNNLEKIQYKGDKAVLRPLPLLSLLPMNLNNYYRYRGSLTTPPCLTSVIWTVFHDHIDISHTQMNRIRSLLHSTTQEETIQGKTPSALLRNNFRPLQQLGARTVYSSDLQHATLFTSPLSSPISVTLALLLGFVVMFLLLNRPSRQEISDSHIHNDHVD